MQNYLLGVLLGESVVGCVLLVVKIKQILDLRVNYLFVYQRCFSKDEGSPCVAYKSKFTQLVFNFSMYLTAAV